MIKIHLCLSIKKTKNKNRTYQKRERKERLLEGLLYCKECGNRLGVLYRKKQDYWCINCNKYTRDPVRKLCTPHFLAYDYFEEIVLKEIKKLLLELFNDLDINELNNAVLSRTKSNNDDYKKAKENIIKEQEKILDMIKTIYHDRLDWNITPDQYKILSKPYDERLKELNSQLEDINIEIEKRKNNADKLPNYINKIKRLLNLDNPNKDLLFALIEKIEADVDRNITITFRYDLIEPHTFRYEDKRIHNPYGRKGRKI